MINRDGEARFRETLAGDHRPQVELAGDFLSDRHAEMAAAMGRHEVDDLGSNCLGGGEEVPLVFPLLGVNHNHNTAVGQGFNGFFNRCILAHR